MDYDNKKRNIIVKFDSETKIMEFENEQEKVQFYQDVLDENYAKWLFYTCNDEEVRMLAFFAAQTNSGSLGLLTGAITLHPDTKKPRLDLKVLMPMLCNVRKQNMQEKFMSLQLKGILLFDPVNKPYFTINPTVRNVFRSIIDANRLA